MADDNNRSICFRNTYIENLTDGIYRRLESERGKASFGSIDFYNFTLNRLRSHETCIAPN